MVESSNSITLLAIQEPYETQFILCAENKKAVLLSKKYITNPLKLNITYLVAFMTCFTLSTEISNIQ